MASRDRVSWSALRAGVAGAHCVGGFDAGAGPQLRVGGGAQPITNMRLSRWCGAAWLTVEGGASPGFVLELKAAPTAAGDSLFARGRLSTLAWQTSSKLAELRACLGPGVAYCFGDGSGAACACNNRSVPGAQRTVRARIEPVERLRNRVHAVN